MLIIMFLLILTKATTNSAVIREYVVTTTIASIPVTLGIVVFIIAVSITDPCWIVANVRIWGNASIYIA